MKFFDIRPFVLSNLEDVVEYLKERLNPGLKDLYAGLRKLDFSNNFTSFEWAGEITAGATIAIGNALTTIPKYRIITRCIPLAAGTTIIDDSQTEWTTRHLYLRNIGTANAKLRVVFFE